MAIGSWQQQWRSIIKALTTKKLLKNSTATILWSFSIWSKSKRWKRSISGCLMSSPKKQKTKTCHFDVLCSLILRNNNEPSTDQVVTYNEKLTVYGNQWQPALWLDREVAPKHFPNQNLHPKKVRVTLCCLLIHYSFLNSREIITSEKYAQQIDGMHQKLSCMQPAFVNRKGPILHVNARLQVAQSMIQKLKRAYLVVQRLRFWASNAGGLGSISGQGIRSHMPQLKISCANN